MPTRILALLAALLSTAAFAAEDKCLEGASRLTDQRAIDALRADTETTCPCASYTAGTPGNDRKAFQNCAKGVQKSALAAGELRKKCKAYTTQVNKGATCGSELVACGLFDADARKPFVCKPKKPGACIGKHGAVATACTNETHCRDVLDWTASTCLDTRDNGPYAAGVRTITFTKPSETDPSQMRTLNTVIWYPAPAGSSPINAGYAAVVDAPLASGAPFPMVMFSHGSCGYPLQSTFLTAFLATHGFIVVAPPHPGNTISDFPSCGSPATQVNSAAERPADIRFVIDEMLAEDQDAGSPFFGAIDDTKIGMSGHSFGGFTTYFVAQSDPRVKVAIPMAPAAPGIALPVPSLTMLGQIDAVVNVPAIRDDYEIAAPPKYLVEIKDTGHYAFSNGCFASPDCNPPVTLTQAEAHLLVNRWVLPFLEVYLVGDDSYAPLLSPPAPPSVVLDREL
jgi:predicted dienelactone hydrolase